MVLAHAPVILPAVLRRPLPYRTAMWIPLALLHIGLLTRIGAGNGLGQHTAWQLGSWDAPHLVVDWAPLVDALLADVEAATPVGTMAARLHNSLAEMAVAVALALGETRLLLTGGCFQKRDLTNTTAAKAQTAGGPCFSPPPPPPNDGRIAPGQILAGVREPQGGTPTPGAGGQPESGSAAPRAGARSVQIPVRPPLRRCGGGPPAHTRTAGRRR